MKRQIMLTRWILMLLAVGCTPPPSRVAPENPLPAGDSTAIERLNTSPRHGEWAMVPAESADSIRAWVVFPERSDKAPVVIVIHEIFGLTPWVRAVADQLAAEGFIAVAPDLLTSARLPGSPADDPPRQDAIAAIQKLDPEVVQRGVDAAARYGMSLPAAKPRYGVIGFCWGGTASFRHAAHSTSAGAAVVYYGGTPDDADFGAIAAPVLGLYGGNDSRVNATIPAARSGMAGAGKRFEPRVFPGAGHGFLRAQSDSSNFSASKEAWPLTIAFLRRHLGE